MQCEENVFDASIESTDWRSSAAILGLIRYLDYFQLPYNKEQLNTSGKEKEWDVLRFYQKDITKEHYLEFAEYYFRDFFYHIKVEEMLSKEEFTKDEISVINKLLAGNKVLQNVFGETKFDGTNHTMILNIINENRNEIIKESFRNKPNLYKNFCNGNQLFSEQQNVCRLNGYNIDVPKKGKSISYQFNPSTFVSNDSPYYDFIIFAFANGRESFFINDNSSIQQIVRSNTELQRKVNEAKEKMDGSVDNRRMLFQAIIESSEFIDYDVEIIVKNQENGFFETLFLRQESIHILKKIKHFEAFCFSYKVNENYYKNVQKEVIHNIVNLLRMDHLIDYFLKESCNPKVTRNFQYLISQMIDLNEMIINEIRKHDRKNHKDKGDYDMTKAMKSAYMSAKEVVSILIRNKQKNKITSYRTKLISAIVLNDYERFCDILIQLSQYTDLQFNFAYDLFEDFDSNKDLAYTFVNALSEKKVEHVEGGNEE